MTYNKTLLQSAQANRTQNLIIIVNRIGPIIVVSFLFIWQLSLSPLDDHDYIDDILLLLVPRNCHLSKTRAITHRSIHTNFTQLLVNKWTSNTTIFVEVHFHIDVDRLYHIYRDSISTFVVYPIYMFLSLPS